MRICVSLHFFAYLLQADRLGFYFINWSNQPDASQSRDETGPYACLTASAILGHEQAQSLLKYVSHFV